MSAPEPSPAPSPPGSRMPGVVDSALVLAVTGALCFGLGHLANLRDARELGLPYQLLPKLPAETQAMIGAGYVLLIALFALGVYFVAVLAARALPAGSREAVAAWVAGRFGTHPQVYTGLAVVTATTAVYVLMWNIPLLSTWRYHDDRLTPVKSLQCKAASSGNLDLSK